MTLLLIMGAALVFLAIVLVSVSAGTTSGGQAATGVDRSVQLVQALTNAPTAMTKEFQNHFFTGNWLTGLRKLSRVKCCGHQCRPGRNTSACGCRDVITIQYSGT